MKLCLKLFALRIKKLVKSPNYQKRNLQVTKLCHIIVKGSFFNTCFNFFGTLVECYIISKFLLLFSVLLNL